MRFLTIPEIAELLRVSRARAYQLVRLGVVPAVRLGRQVRVEEGALRHWIEREGSMPSRTQPAHQQGHQ